VGTTAGQLPKVEIMTTEPSTATSLVVCSLEEWGTVRRRIRIMVDELVAGDPHLSVLYVAPALDIPFELRQGRFTGLFGPRMETVHPRVHVLRPRKWLPRFLGPAADRSLGRQVATAVESLGLPHPLMWINDASYARFGLSTGWPTVYDVTDDWLLVPLAPHRAARLREDDALLLERSDAVVVCSPELARTRGTRREVEIIPNGVDVDLFRTPQTRPAALPPGPVAVYVGTLHEERIDVPLIVDLAEAQPKLQIALVGPDRLGPETSARLAGLPSIHLIGAQPYGRIPGFLQHADVVVIPHLVNPFTESLDPIKAYECLATGRPTVATPVAWFRELGPPIVVVDRSGFIDEVARLLDEPPDGNRSSRPQEDVPTWRERAEAMLDVMQRVRAGAGS
jgi:glycosyltransferase involved in cell wall biosynthesis